MGLQPRMDVQIDLDNNVVHFTVQEPLAIEPKRVTLPIAVVLQIAAGYIMHMTGGAPAVQPASIIPGG